MEAKINTVVKTIINPAGSLYSQISQRNHMRIFTFWQEQLLGFPGAHPSWQTTVCLKRGNGAMKVTEFVELLLFSSRSTKIQLKFGINFW